MTPCELAPGYPSLILTPRAYTCVRTPTHACMHTHTRTHKELSPNRPDRHVAAGGESISLPFGPGTTSCIKDRVNL